jgi:hypothetical protein
VEKKLKLVENSNIYENNIIISVEAARVMMMIIIIIILPCPCLCENMKVLEFGFIIGNVKILH